MEDNEYPHNDACGLHLSAQLFTNLSHEPASQLNAIDGEIEAHLSAIEKHKAAILALKSYTNGMQPVSRLPPEMLTKVFMMHIAEFVTDSDSSNWHPSLWIAFSHVCRHWRSLALACPMLWSSITFMNTSSSSISELLARTKRAPLTLAAEPGMHGSLQELDNRRNILQTLLIEEMPRISELAFALHPHIEAMGSAEMLQKLSIFGNSHDVEKHLTPLSEILYGGDAPVLEHLRIVIAPFMWHPTAHFPNLKVFDLWMNPAWGFQSPIGIVSSIVASLERMPALEVLKFNSCLPKDLRPAESSDRVATLSHLREITLSDTMEACVNILTYLNCPAAKKISMSLIFPDDATDLHLARIPHIPGLRYASLRPVRNGNEEFLVHISADDPSSASIRLRISVDLTVSQDQVYRTLSQIMPLSEVETLAVNSLRGASPTTLKNLFGQMSNLQVLRIGRDTDLVSLLSTLFPLPNPNSMGNHDQAFLPQLQTLHFLRIRFPLSGEPERAQLEDLRSYRRWEREDSGIPRVEGLLFGAGCNHSDEVDILPLLWDITGASMFVNMGDEDEEDTDGINS